MQLIFITRKVDKNDDRSGFVYDWIEEFSRHLDRLVVICQETGDLGTLPENVAIYSLGKEKKNPKLKQFYLFHKHLSSHTPNSAGIFAHMMPIYSILAGPWAKIYRKKLIQWYTHSSLDWRIKFAGLWADEFATASQKSFNLQTKKPVHILGHGIKLDKFKPSLKKSTTTQNEFNILSIGRISPSKDYESIIKAIYELKEQGSGNINLSIIGSPALNKQQRYMQNLQSMVDNMQLKGKVKFMGGMPQSQIIKYLQSADLFINLSETHSLDKAVLEAMACEVPTLTSNRAFIEVLPKMLIVDKDNPRELAQKIAQLLSLLPKQRNQLVSQLRVIVETQHNLNNLAKKVVRLYE